MITKKQAKTAMKNKLKEIILELARREKNTRVKQTFFDLAGMLEASTGAIDHSKLPVEPSGFCVPHAVLARCGRMPSYTLCTLQVITMAVLYLWMFVKTEDQQDARSLNRYLSWLEGYMAEPETYDVVGNERTGYYLFKLPGEVIKPPEWLKAEGGETI